MVRGRDCESLLPQTGVILCGDAKSFVLGRVIAGEAEVLTLATHPDHQRTRAGTGRSLRTFLIACQRGQGAECVYFWR